MVWVFVMYALFGSIFSVGKIAVVASQPYFLTAMRMLLAGSCLIGYLYLRGPSKLKIPRSTWKYIGIVAFFNVFLTNAFEFWGLQYMNAGKTSLIYNLAPFISAGIAYAFGTERITAKKCLGLAVAMSALAPLMLEPWFVDEATEMTFLELAAEGALLVSAASSVIGWIFVKKLTGESNLPGTVVNGYSFVIAGLICLVPSLAFEQWNPVPVTEWHNFLWTLAYIVIVHNLICYSIFAFSLRRYSVTFMTFAGLSNSIFAGLFGWVFLGEDITLSFILAFVGIALGLGLFYMDEETESTVSKENNNLYVNVDSKD
jgi:drug/metabolite transporter (DMT)-like permease